MTPGVEKRNKFRLSWSNRTPGTPQQSLRGNWKKRADEKFSTENVIHSYARDTTRD